MDNLYIVQAQAHALNFFASTNFYTLHRNSFQTFNSDFLQYGNSLIVVRLNIARRLYRNLLIFRDIERGWGRNFLGTEPERVQKGSW